MGTHPAQLGPRARWAAQRCRAVVLDGWRGGGQHERPEDAQQRERARPRTAHEPAAQRDCSAVHIASIHREELDLERRGRGRGED